ncbi:hypothetical protein [Thermomicrobium sp.]
MPASRKPNFPREHFVELGRKSAQRRRGSIILSADEARRLVAAYEALAEIAKRARRAARGDAAHATENEGGRP